MCKFKKLKVYNENQNIGGPWALTISFCILQSKYQVGWERSTSIFAIYFFRTLGSYSYLVIGNCPLFKYSLYYVIITNMAKQKLSLTAKKAKAKRDLERAKRKDRKDKKAENQRKRRAAKKKGKNVKGKDFDHKDRKFKSVKKNRGNDGKGTKREGKKKYKTCSCKH